MSEEGKLALAENARRNAAKRINGSAWSKQLITIQAGYQTFYATNH